jgi:hypothetical protein
VALTQISSLSSHHCSFFTHSLVNTPMPVYSEKIADPERGFEGSESVTLEDLGEERWSETPYCSVYCYAEYMET